GGGARSAFGVRFRPPRRRQTRCTRAESRLLRAHTSRCMLPSPTQGQPDVPPPEGPTAPRVPPVVVPKWVLLVLLPLARIGLWALARAAGPVLLILMAASTLALILNPLVQ